MIFSRSVTALRWSIHTGIIIVLRALWPEVDAPARGIIDHALLFFENTCLCLCPRQVANLAKQTNRTNTIHPSREFYPQLVFTPPTASAAAPMAQWRGAHAPGDWTSGFWPGVNWQLAALTGEPAWAEVAAQYAVGMSSHNVLQFVALTAVHDGLLCHECTHTFVYTHSYGTLVYN